MRYHEQLGRVEALRRSLANAATEGWFAFANGTRNPPRVGFRMCGILGDVPPTRRR